MRNRTTLRIAITGLFCLAVILLGTTIGAPSGQRQHEEATTSIPLRLPGSWLMNRGPWSTTPRPQLVAEYIPAKVVPAPPPPTTTTTTASAPVALSKPAAPPTPPPASTTPAPVVSSGNDAIWTCIRDHESGDRYTEDTGNGYYGAVQWLPATWNAATIGAGFSQYANGRADLAPPAVQDVVAVYWQGRAGWGQWSTARGCGA